MPTYSKKPGAPTVIDLGQALAAEIVGTDGAWMGQFIPFLGSDIVDVDAMCRAGPPAYVDLSPLDFVGLPIGPTSMVGKLQKNAVALVFPTYCQSSAAGPPGVYGPRRCFTVVAPGGQAPTSWWASSEVAPPATTHGRFRWQSISGLMDGWPLHVYHKDSLGADVEPRKEIGKDVIAANLNSYNELGPLIFNMSPGDYIRLEAYTQITVTACIEYDDGGSAPIPEPPAPQPSGLPVYPKFNAADIAGLSASLDDIRMLLWNLMACCDTLMDRTLLPGTLDATSTTAAAQDVTVDLAGAKGILLTVLGRPAWLGSQPDDPTRFFRMGRYTLGTVDGWGLSVPIEHDVTTVEPLPLGTTRVGVHVNPPMTATVARLK